MPAVEDRTRPVAGTRNTPVPTTSEPFLRSSVALFRNAVSGPLRNTAGNPVSADCSSDTVPLFTIERESDTNNP